MIFSSRYQIDIPEVDVLSYVFGTVHLAVTCVLLSCLLIQTTETSASQGDLPIFADAEKPTRSLRKPELEACVKKLAGGLRQTLGLQNDDVVLAYTENSVSSPTVMDMDGNQPLIPCLITPGGIFTGANPGYTESELTHQLTVSGAKCIFTDAVRLTTALQAARSVGIPKESVVLVDNEGRPRHDSWRTMQTLMAEPYSWEAIRDPSILAENGTTGKPKACMITHCNLVANAEQTLHLDRVSESRANGQGSLTHDVHCAFLPLYHASGLMTYCVVNVRRSCTTFTMRKFSLELLLSTIQRFRVTHLLLAPPVVVMLLKSNLLLHFDVSSVRSMFCGAAPLQPELSKRLEEVFSGGKARSRQGWGMSEATMAVTLFAPDEFDPLHKGVGYILPNMQMKIVGDDGREVGCNEEGEALIRGPNVFKGYYKNPSASEEAWTKDGWLKTGDIVSIQESGLLTILDRKKELIKVKGFQVAPAELEGHLLEHEGVRDCAVIRVTREGQEHPQAHIVPKDNNVTAESIIKFMESRLSAHKRLTGGIVFTEVIPKSASGKILRRLLQDPATEKLARL
ncbi:hypothetical protein BDP55DRAFT_629428 [Colletotrichum godetiae]|uniref:AMP-binding enzyme n=1 Tax=Colletotrichum godetiae TaxID=1209918 RepID=A0AAJ0F0V2_9PEZI|nr:uncharacterized protein BDP55DRAFT_629428 [Colletotrichum godetiae]KAK1688888.1 hypothetical protein BDP55DRAFT_629428 [Colletotrichum godetiae]